jgi:hypothetical protein
MTHYLREQVLGQLTEANIKVAKVRASFRKTQLRVPTLAQIKAALKASGVQYVSIKQTKKGQQEFTQRELWRRAKEPNYPEYAIEFTPEQLVVLKERVTKEPGPVPYSYVELANGISINAVGFRR